MSDDESPIPDPVQIDNTGAYFKLGNVTAAVRLDAKPDQLGDDTAKRKKPKYTQKKKIKIKIKKKKRERKKERERDCSVLWFQMKSNLRDETFVAASFLSIHETEATGFNRPRRF